MATIDVANRYKDIMKTVVKRTTEFLDIGEDLHGAICFHFQNKIFSHSSIQMTKLSNEKKKKEDLLK